MKKSHKPQSKQSGKSQRGEVPVQQSAVAASPRSSENPAVVVKEVGDEPTMGRSSIPVLLIALLVGLIYWGNMYIVQNGGQLDARVHAPYRNWKELESLKPQDELALLAAQGGRIYSQYCASCHMGDGNGNASSGFPPLVGSEWVLAKDPSRIIRIVLNGLGGPISVKGKEYGQAQMLPWRDALKDEDVAAVLTFVRNNWGNKAPPVDPVLVKPIREQTADKGGPWSAEELLKVPIKE
jgi:mono/diheme cytochrome c family protein